MLDCAVLIALGIAPDGRRHILGLSVALGVAQAFTSGVWREEHSHPTGTTKYPVRVASDNAAWNARYGGRLLGNITVTRNNLVGLGDNNTTDVGIGVTFTMPGSGLSLGMDSAAWQTEDARMGGDTANCTNGMATYSAHAMQASLAIADMPLGYEPAFGPALNLRISYSHADDRQSSGSAQSHFGPNWTCNWFAWLDSVPATSVRVSSPGGGTETYSQFDAATQTFTAARRGGSVVKQLANGGFERQFPDGSAEVYATTSPGLTNRFFLSSVRDGWGNSVQLNYGSNGDDLRLESITDAAGKTTVFEYAGGVRLQVTGISDPFGRQAVIAYYADGRLQSITDPLGVVSTVTWRADDNFVVTLTTPYGVSHFSNGYMNAPDGSIEGRWLEMVDPRGGKERVEYRNGTVAVGGDPAGPRTYFWPKSAYALPGQSQATNNPPAHSLALKNYWMVDSATGLASGLPYSVKPPLEAAVYHSYQSSVAPGGPATTVGSDALLIQTQRTLDGGTVQPFSTPTYNAMGRPTASVDPLGRSTGMSYAANGVDLLEARQTTGGISDLLAKFENYVNHQPQLIRDAAGQATGVAYNTRGQVSTVTDAEGKVVKFVYEEINTKPEFGRIKTVTAAFGTASAATTTYGYDAYARVASVTDPENYTLTLAYDAVGGNPLATLDRTVRVTFPDTTYEETRYDDARWPLSVAHTRDRRGRETSLEYDATGNVVRTTDPAGRVIQIGRCLCGAISTLTDANGKVTEWVRDIQMRVTNKAINMAEAYSIAYEPSTSRVKKVTDAKGQVANYEYFADNSLKRVYYTDATTGNPLSTPEVNFTYDPQRPRLATMTDTTGVTAYTYHPVNASDGVFGDGMLATADGPLAEDTFTYGYDALGRVVSRSLGGAGTTNVVAYGFNDPLGRLKTVTDPLGEFTRSYEGVTGRVANVQRLGGMRTVFSWEPGADRRLTGIRYEDGAANVLAQFGYGYQFPDTTNDPTAQIRQWTQWHRGLGGTPATQAKKWDFRYDDVDQLIEAAKAPLVGGAVESSLGYGYDAAGNRNQILENGVAQEFTVNGKNELTGTAATQSAPVRFAGTVSAASTVTLAGQPATMSANGLSWEKTLALSSGAQSLELLATETTPPPGKPAETTRRHVNLTLTAAPPWTFAYDDNGSLLSTNNSQLSTSYEWDAANRLSAIVKNGKRTEFTYDGQSRWTRLVEKDGLTTAAPVLSTRRFVWEGYSIAQIRDYDASDTLTGVRHIFGEGEVRTTTLTQSLPTGTSLLHLRDHLGSVRELVNATDLAMRARYDYGPYGQRTKLAGDLDSDFGFTGHYEHSPSGLTLAPFRAYHSSLGRWLSRDPIGEEGGINLYGYVGNRPSSFVDSLGLKEVDLDFMTGMTRRDWVFEGMIPQVIVRPSQIAEGTRNALNPGDTIGVLTIHSHSIAGQAYFGETTGTDAVSIYMHYKTGAWRVRLTEETRKTLVNLSGLLGKRSKVVLAQCEAAAGDEGTLMMQYLAQMLGVPVMGATGEYKIGSGFGGNYKVGFPSGRVWESSNGKVERIR